MTLSNLLFRTWLLSSLAMLPAVARAQITGTPKASAVVPGVATLGAPSGAAQLGSDSLALPENTPRVVSIAALRARAYSTLTDGSLIHVLGYYSSGDGGGGTFAWSASSTATDDLGVTINPTGHSGAGRWIRQLDGVKSIGSQIYGGVCPSTYADDTAAQQSAINLAQMLNVPVHFGGYLGYRCVINAPLTATDQLSIKGDGPAISQMVMTYNGPLLNWTINNDVTGFDIGGFGVTAQIANGQPYNLTSAITFSGNNTSHLSYGRIHDIDTYGVWSAFINNKAPFTTGNGPEGTLDWIDWDKINIEPGINYPVHGWYSTNGSGTGQTYRSLKANMSSPTPSSVLDFEGAGNVVGDILIIGGDVGGSAQSALLRIGTGTIYRTNIAVVGTQIDAGMPLVFDFAADYMSTPFMRINFSGDNGGSTVATVPLLQSNIQDSTKSEWSMGSTKTSSATGPQTVPLFSVTLGTSFSGTRCSLGVSGVVAGQQGGMTAGEWILGTTGANAVVTALIGPTSTVTTGTAFFTLIPTASGNVVTFSTAFSATSAGSSLDAQIKCGGGSILVSRL